MRLVIALLLAGAVSAQMTGTYSVNPTQPATASNFQTLAAATAALAAGVSAPVTIEVYDDGGDYTEMTPMPAGHGTPTWAPLNAVLVFAPWPGVSALNRVTFIAAPGESPVLNASGRAMGVYWGGADFVTLDGFEIHSPLFDGINMYCNSTSGDIRDAIIRNCVIHDVPSAGIVIYGNTPSPANTLVENNVFYRCALSPSGGFADACRHTYIGTRRDVGTRIVHNTFYGDAFPASPPYPTGFLGTWQVAPGTPWAECSNNVFFITTACAGFMRNRENLPTLPNPVAMRSDGNCFHDTTGSPFATIDTVAIPDLATWQATFSLDASSITGDPLLVDPLVARDFHLQGGSPCINAGVTLSAATLEDFEGDARDATPDIGADELGVSILSVDTLPTQVAPGATGILVTMEVANGLPLEDVAVSAVALSFVGSADRTPEYVVTPDPANPLLVAAASSAIFQFSVDVDAMASEESITIDGSFAGITSVSMTMLSVLGAAVPDQWDVIGARPEVRAVDALPATVAQGSAGHQVDISVENVGLTVWTPGLLTLSFTDSLLADRSAEYLVMPTPGSPTMVAPSATALFTVIVDVDAAATVDSITLDVALFEGTDAVTGRAQGDSGADVTDTWVVETCGATLCGDCTGDGIINILDALAAAQHGAGLLTLVGTDFTNCNVIGLLEPDPGADVGVLDALTVAQSAAGLPVVLTCC